MLLGEAPKRPLKWGCLRDEGVCFSSFPSVVCTVHTRYCAWWEEWAVAKLQATAMSL